jgi:hypothetical protein
MHAIRRRVTQQNNGFKALALKQYAESGMQRTKENPVGRGFSPDAFRLNRTTNASGLKPPTHMFLSTMSMVEAGGLLSPKDPANQMFPVLMFPLIYSDQAIRVKKRL